MSAASLVDGPVLQPAVLASPPVGGGTGWRVHVYAHTHWDREWYRSFERFRMQLVGMVDRVLDVLDRDARFATFVLDGQTIVLDDYLEIRPEEEPRIRRLVGAGRLEIGPWHVLPDEFLVSGESLVRNLLEGRRVATRFGDPLAVGYLPDPFGHIAQLPAVLQGFGIDNVIFSRGIGDDTARLGSEFRWESPGGSTDVLALVQGSPYTSGYCNAELLGRGNGSDDLAGYAAVAELAPWLVERARGDAMLLAAGCDHETIQQELPDIVERLGAVLPGCDVRISGLGAFVSSVRDSERRLEADGRPLGRYRGELRGSLHAPILASIFSARVPLKQDNDRVQVLLERHVEPLMAVAVAAGVRARRDVQPFLRHAWRLVLENHPHDSIGGCSVDDVHLEMPARTLRAEAVAHALVEDLRVVLQLGDQAVVHDAEGRGGIGERADGTPVALAPALPGQLVPLAGVGLEDGAEVVDECTVRAGDLHAGVVDGRLEIRRGASIVRLDWIDEADAGDSYDFGRLDGDVALVARIERVDARVAGPGVAELDVCHTFDLPIGLDGARTARSSERVRTELRTRVRVSEASSLAQLVVELENRSLDHRLRLRASVDGAPDVVEALGHFAVIERPVRPAEPEQQWRQSPPGLDHCAGVVRMGSTLLAGRGMHEYEAHDGRLELTVLRSVGWLSRDDVAGRPGHAGPALEAPGAQCLGALRLDLAVGVGPDPSWADARAFLAQPLVLEPFGIGQAQVARAEPIDGVPMESGAAARARDLLAQAPRDAQARIAALGLELDADGAVSSACKLADDDSGDLILRWWAPAAPAGVVAGRDRALVRVRAREDLIDAVYRARLDETLLGPVPWQDGSCEVAIRPGAIVTLRLRLV